MGPLRVMGGRAGKSDHGELPDGPRGGYHNREPTPVRFSGDHVMVRADSASSAANDVETLYQQRLARYVTAMRNEKPDMIPIRPFAAEFTGVYSGHTCQELAHDYHRAFDAACRCAADFDWDAVVANMVYVWTGLRKSWDSGTTGFRESTVRPPRGFNTASRRNTTRSCEPMNTTS